ncbi:hypothetical protein ABH994_005678 [Bradyrhizobium yuanmingense]|uniref:Uncharacterized protein n=1 Tax=Bradyrhizobium yuanmingense TaxID=108015 RepID=A0ABV4GM11_9BRAD
MDFNAVAPANTSPEPDAARTASDATEFDRQLSDAQAPALAQGVAHPLLQGEAYSIWTRAIPTLHTLIPDTCIRLTKI